MGMYLDVDHVGSWRDIEGTVPLYDDPEWADGATDQPGTPDTPVYTRVEGPWGVPWFDGHEDPNIATGLYASNDPLPWSPYQDVGGQSIVGAYEGAYRTHGPVNPNINGLEASGGMIDTPNGMLMGDQMIGRLMRFPANIPGRYDTNGVYGGMDYRDELAALIANGDAPIVSDTEVTTNLVNWPNTTSY